MSLPSASRLPRAMICPASHVLPQAASTSEPATGGTIKHAFLEAASRHGREAALADVPEQYREACEAIDLSALPVGVQWAPEVALAWDLTDKGRELGRNLGRAYPTTAETEFVGTADVLGLTEDAAVVFDFKTGRVPRKARDDWQLKFLALAACRTYGRSQAVVGLVWIHEDGGAHFDTATLDAFDLDLAAAELRDLAKRLGAESPHIVEGEHCRYCAALASCPPKLALLHATCESPDKALPPTITAENAAAAYRRLRQVEQVCAAAKEALVAFARKTPIDLGDGRVYGPVVGEREKVDPIVAQAVLTKLHGPEVAQAALELDTSKAAIERALRKVPTSRKDGGLGALKQHVLDEIRQAGGIEVRRTTTVREH